MSNEAYGFDSNDSRKLAVNNAYLSVQSGNCLSRQWRGCCAWCDGSYRRWRWTDYRDNRQYAGKERWHSYVVAPWLIWIWKKFYLPSRLFIHLGKWFYSTSKPPVSQILGIDTAGWWAEADTCCWWIKDWWRSGRRKTGLGSKVQSVEMLYSYQCNQSAKEIENQIPYQYS